MVHCTETHTKTANFGRISPLCGSFQFTNVVKVLVRECLVIVHIKCRTLPGSHLWLKEIICLVLPPVNEELDYFCFCIISILNELFKDIINFAILIKKTVDAASHWKLLPLLLILDLQPCWIGNLSRNRLHPKFLSHLWWYTVRVNKVILVQVLLSLCLLFPREVIVVTLGWWE